MAKLKSGIVLGEDENLVMEIEAELWATSSNPIARFFGAIAKFFAMLLGRRMKSFLVITDKRVVECKTFIYCFCFTIRKEIIYVLPNSVKEIGYTREATFLCCCPSFHLYYDSFTQRTVVMLKGANEKGAQQAADAFYYAINHAVLPVSSSSTGENKVAPTVSKPPSNMHSCPQCGKSFKIDNPGKYRCPSCGGTIAV